jgi:UDP-GlcNAc:undecaprenyl-phosphate GlcNAc-1-phosphate transferase
MSIPLIGVILGFLRYNTHPAKIFMGDGGSNWLGYMLGVMILIVLERIPLELLPKGQWGLARIANFVGNSPSSPLQAYELSRALPFCSVILCLAIPIVDTASVIFLRLKAGRSPFAPDQSHFHHSLLRLGLTQSQCVGSIYFIALSFGVLGLFPVLFPKYNFSAIPYIALALITLLISLTRLVDDKFIERLSTQSSHFVRTQPLGVRLKAVVRMLETSNRYIIYAILLGVPFFSGNVDLTIGYFAFFALTLLLLTRLLKTKQDDFLNSFVFLVCVVTLLMSNNQHVILIQFNGKPVELNGLYNSLFGWLALTTALIFIATFRRRYLIFSPSDFLMLVFPLVLLLIPEPYRSTYHIDAIVLRSLVLFLAIHILTRRQKSISAKIRVVLVNALLFVGTMGVFGLRVAY